MIEIIFTIVIGFSINLTIFANTNYINEEHEQRFTDYRQYGGCHNDDWLRQQATGYRRCESQLFTCGGGGGEERGGGNHQAVNKEDYE